MVRFLERFCAGTEAVAGLLLALVTVLIVVSAVGRYLFAVPVPDSFDLSRLLIGAAVMWGFAALGFRGSHIKVEIFAEALPRPVRRVVDAFAWTLVLVFVVLLAWKMFARVDRAYSGGEATFDLRLVVWPLLGVIWLGAAAAVLTVAARLGLIILRGDTLDHAERIDQDDEAHG
ncbi:TRAP transporter small permease [Acuticoccus sediminis]|uniref:TRAP transporter small permease protein n=1 Tax=Acuticoccus sediminis TaxID=2184697 RepID=A0A8B2NL82_9HYPH|nr:TRAP transporter small permease subunit [Acuticoccus sediminis]RAH98855.1 TRAP transporter small permease [Acuticoccus sediminis]